MSKETVMVSRIKFPLNAYNPTPTTGEYVALLGKRDFKDVHQLGTLRCWAIFQSGWTNLIWNLLKVEEGAEGDCQVIPFEK